MIKINKTLFIIGIILVIIISIVSTIIDNNHIDKLNQEFSENIVNAGNITNKIIDVKKWHGVSNITLDNGDKYFCRSTLNYNYNRPSLISYLIDGNIIIKKEGIDSLWIKSTEGTFVFVVGESINKDKR